MNEGKKTEIKRIYNRVIFDDLQQQSAEVQEKGNILFEDLMLNGCRIRIGFIESANTLFLLFIIPMCRKLIS